MQNGRPSAGLIIRSIYALCLLVATCTHAGPILQHGLFWDYGGVGRLTAAFWTSLAIADPLAAVCLFLWPRVGLALTTGIIGLDVLHNAVVFGDVLRRSAAFHLGTYAVFLGIQAAFLLFVIATVRVPWSQARGGSPPSG